MKIFKYIPYNAKLKKVASEMRKNQTASEIKVWEYLKYNFPDLIFNRQKPLGEFVVDFYCSKCSIILEIDGDIHLVQKERDAERDNYFLTKYNLRTIRITNSEVYSDVNIVGKKIVELIPSLKKEG